MRKGEKRVAHSNIIMKLAIEHDSARERVTDIDKKYTLLSGLTQKFDVTEEAIMDVWQGYHEAVPKIIVHETIPVVRR